MAPVIVAQQANVIECEVTEIDVGDCSVAEHLPARVQFHEHG